VTDHSVDARLIAEGVPNAQNYAIPGFRAAELFVRLRAINNYWEILPTFWITL